MLAFGLAVSPFDAPPMTTTHLVRTIIPTWSSSTSSKQDFVVMTYEDRSCFYFRTQVPSPQEQLRQPWTVGP